MDEHRLFLVDSTSVILHQDYRRSGFECLCWKKGKTFHKVTCTLSVFTTSLSLRTLNTLLFLCSSFLFVHSCQLLLVVSRRRSPREEILASSVLATAAFFSRVFRVSSSPFNHFCLQSKLCSSTSLHWRSYFFVSCPVVANFSIPLIFSF